MHSLEAVLFLYPGRAIRHRGDYATILLLDQRYGSARIQGSLPGWISNRLQHHARFGSAFAAIRKVGMTSPQSFQRSFVTICASWKDCPKFFKFVVSNPC